MSAILYVYGDGDSAKAIIAIDETTVWMKLDKLEAADASVKWYVSNTMTTDAANRTLAEWGRYA